MDIMTGLQDIKFSLNFEIHGNDQVDWFWILAVSITSNNRIITVRNEVAKVMFLQACVCPQGGCLLLGGVSAPRGVSAPGGGVGIPACTEAEPPGRDGYCGGRYASYWNALLFLHKKIDAIYSEQGNDTGEPLADPRGEGGNQGCVYPSWWSSFIFMQFLINIWPNNRLAPTSLGLAPPVWEILYSPLRTQFRFLGRLVIQ